MIGSEAAVYFAGRGFDIVGIDNDMRQYFFGKEASTAWNRDLLKEKIKNYRHHDLDIRDREGLEKIFAPYNKDIQLIIHAAAQPSHDWAAREPAPAPSVYPKPIAIVLRPYLFLRARIRFMGICPIPFP